MYKLATLILVFCIGYSFDYRLPDRTLQKLKESQQYKLTASQISQHEWNPIRIHFEYLQQFAPQDVQFINQIFSVAQAFLSKHLLVQTLTDKITFKKSYPTKWYGFDIPQHLTNKAYDADLVFFINIENQPNQTYLAYAAPAIFDLQTYRPIMGLISWNMKYVQYNYTSNAKFESHVETAIHEMIHGLGFVEDLFDMFYDSTTGLDYKQDNSYVDKYGVLHLRLPRLLKHAQQHYQCKSMKGFPMENEGGRGTAGSHFERSILYNEIMTGSDLTGDIVFTEFTFQMLQDMGYYRIASYTPDAFTWGANKGCEFVNKQCHGGQFEEFCQAQNLDCSFMKTGVSVCHLDPLANKCRFYYIYSNFDCRDAQSEGLPSDSESYQYFGYDSMCIRGSLYTGNSKRKLSCYQYECDASNQLTLIVDGNAIDCSKPSTIKMNGYRGEIECPSNSDSFCMTVNECPNQCNKRGFCTNRTCTCIQGYSGRGCEQQCNQFRYKEWCLNSCPMGTFPIVSQQYCIGCSANCEQCSNFNKCVTCQQGYYLRGGFCDNVNDDDMASDVIMYNMVMILLIQLL